MTFLNFPLFFPTLDALLLGPEDVDGGGLAAAVGHEDALPAGLLVDPLRLWHHVRPGGDESAAGPSKILE